MAAIFSTLEINVAIICASLLIVKPLLIRLLPALLGEEPFSAREERRMLRAATGMHHLSVAVVDEEKAERESRRDTAVAVDDRRGQGVMAREMPLLHGRWYGRPHSWPVSKSSRYAGNTIAR